jgi:hypothetical protein
MYHLELRQFPHNHCRFNLTDGQLRAVVEPWVREQAVELGERKWSPHTARLTILEGPQLAVEQLSMGRGWRTAQRQSVDVTERVLAAAKDATEAADAAAQAGRTIAGSSGSSGGAQPPADPLALGVLADLRSVASLLGGDPARLLAAWRAVAARSPGLSPSDSLALAEQELGSSAANPG